MDVVFVLVRHVVVDDAVHVVDVDAAGGDVRRDQDGELALAEGRHRALAGRLLDVAVQAVGLNAGAAQVVREPLAHDFGVAEDDHALERAGAQDAQHGLLLLQTGNGDGVLVDVRLALQGGGDGDLHLVALVHPADRHDLLRDRRGEQAEIDAVFDLVEDLRHVVEEAHVEHAVGLVEDDGLDLVEPQIFAVVVIHEAAGGRHDDVRVLLKLVDLRLHARAAVDHGHADALIEGEQAVHLVADLQGEFAGRGEDQRLQVVAFGVDMLDHRDAEGEGLARAGRRLGDDVLPLHERRDRLLLHLRRRGHALLLQRAEDLCADAELRESFCRFHTVSSFKIADISQYTFLHYSRNKGGLQSF